MFGYLYNSKFINMKPSLETKAAISIKLNDLLNERKAVLENTITDLKKSRDNETKSSVGDKFETGRARLQTEIDHYDIQVNKAQQAINELSQIDTNKEHQKVALGSLLVTTNGNYFISIGFGKIEVLENSYYVISLASPVGQLFKDKTVGEVVQHYSNTFKILELI